MRTNRRELLGVAASAAALFAQEKKNVKFVRYRTENKTSYGILDGEIIREISDAPFRAYKETGVSQKLAQVKLLFPSTPPKIFAVGLNYKSHIGDRKPPANPEIFYKPITCLLNPGDPIVIPRTATDVHYEGELVIVIGKRARNLSAADARDVIFGFTCGNDVSERQWQNGPNKDLQWWRAKGADTFGPLGPAIVTGLDSSKLQLQTRLNGKVVQKQTTGDLLFDPQAIVSWISQAVTLQPGDLIFTGTPGTTSKLSPGDTVEVEIEGIGVLRNPVKAG